MLFISQVFVFFFHGGISPSKFRHRLRSGAHLEASLNFFLTSSVLVYDRKHRGCHDRLVPRKPAHVLLPSVAGRAGDRNEV